MQLHANAALSLNGRRELVRLVIEDGLTRGQAAERLRVSEKTCRKWVGRVLAEGPDGLRDRSSAPHVVANKTPADVTLAARPGKRSRKDSVGSPSPGLVGG